LTFGLPLCWGLNELRPDSNAVDLNEAESAIMGDGEQPRYLVTES
jgi:hypothetical protein